VASVRRRRAANEAAANLSRPPAGRRALPGGRPLREIEAVTGVDRIHLYRLLDHCLQPHGDGRVFGWRALVPYARVAEYCRTSRITPRPDGAGAAGAFAVLMQTHPALAAWIAERVHDKRVTIDKSATTVDCGCASTASSTCISTSCASARHRA
jgi:hypothetical protein